ncbi:MAG TPA: DUF4215 domain-containing protein, partial [Sandaracinaceae bacterium]
DCTAPGSGSTCGDGTICADTEICDDGNDVAGDGCNAECTMIEIGWVCTGEPSVCSATCGNATVEAEMGEACDDGDNDDGDGCSATCQIEPGWTCTGSPSTCSAAACGDGIVAGAETCDDGNPDACGTCNDSCNGPGTGLCDDGTGCRDDADCESSFCDSSTNQCTACTADAQCTGSPAGDQCVSGVCAACDPGDHAGCGGATPFCNASRQCVQCLAAGDCDDGNPCTTDSCDASGMCVHTDLDAGACTDGDQMGTCVAGTCCTGCRMGSTCAAGTSASACGDDGAACMACSGSTPACAGGRCVECTADAHCDDGNPCTTDTCNTATNTCAHTALDSGTCTDGGQMGTCVAGSCCTGCRFMGTMCVPGTADDACGTGGGACWNCAAMSQTCMAGTCG